MDKGRVIICPFLYPLFWQSKVIKTRNGDLTNLTLESEVICDEAIQRIQSNSNFDCPLPPIVPVLKTRIKKELPNF